MPAKSERQRKFMAYCQHTDHPPERCPNRQVAREFSRKPAGGYSGTKKKSRK